MKLPRANYEVKRFSSVDSTNRVALELGAQDAVHGTVVLADEQSGGRGRLTRQFSSPKGGLYMSVILRTNLPIENLPLVTLAAGTACATTIKKMTGVRVKLKWPNDIYSNGRKIGGILTEAGPYSHLSDRVPFVVVGIGLNVNSRLESFPATLQNLVSSLYCLTGQEYHIDELLHSLMIALLAEVSLLESDPENVLIRWQDHDYLLGRKLSWQVPGGGEIQGVGNGLMPDGRYRLTSSGGDDYPVLAGDITITQINGQLIK